MQNVILFSETDSISFCPEKDKGETEGLSDGHTNRAATTDNGVAAISMTRSAQEIILEKYKSDKIIKLCSLH